jgi:hypothetical protein
VRNYRNREQTHRIALHTPAGFTTEPAILEGKRVGEGVTSHQVKIRAAANAQAGLHLLAFDITRDGVRHGELFDCIVWVGDPPPDAPKPAAKTIY